MNYLPCECMNEPAVPSTVQVCRFSFMSIVAAFQAEFIFKHRCQASNFL